MVDPISPIQLLEGRTIPILKQVKFISDSHSCWECRWFSKELADCMNLQVAEEYGSQRSEWILNPKRSNDCPHFSGY